MILSFPNRGIQLTIKYKVILHFDELKSKKQVPKESEIKALIEMKEIVDLNICSAKNLSYVFMNYI